MASLLTLNQEMTFLAMDYSAVSQRCQPSFLSEVLSCPTGTLALLRLHCDFNAECLRPPRSPHDAVLTLHGKCSTSALIQALSYAPHVIFSFCFFWTPRIICCMSHQSLYTIPCLLFDWIVSYFFLRDTVKFHEAMSYVS